MCSVPNEIFFSSSTHSNTASKQVPPPHTSIHHRLLDIDIKLSFYNTIFIGAERICTYRQQKPFHSKKAGRRHRKMFVQVLYILRADPELQRTQDVCLFTFLMVFSIVYIESRKWPTLCKVVSVEQSLVYSMHTHHDAVT